jgi:hypothetical protein
MLRTTYTHSDAKVPVTQDRYALGKAFLNRSDRALRAVNCGFLSQRLHLTLALSESKVWQLCGPPSWCSGCLAARVRLTAASPPPMKSSPGHDACCGPTELSRCCRPEFKFHVLRHTYASMLRGGRQTRQHRRQRRRADREQQHHGHAAAYRRAARTSSTISWIESVTSVGL